MHRGRRRADALRSDADAAELRHRGARRRRARSSRPRSTAESRAHTCRSFRCEGPDGSRSRNSRRRTDCRRDRRSARRSGRRRSAQRAHADAGLAVARGRAAARVSGGGVPDAPGARAACPAARLLLLSGTVARRCSSCSPRASIPIVRTSPQRSPSCAPPISPTRLDREYRRRSHRARAALDGRGDGAHQLFLPDARARSVHRAQVRERAASPACPTPRRCTKFTSTARAWKDAICAPARSRAAESASATVPTTYRTEILESDEDPDGQERDHRADRLQGRIHRQTAPRQ